MPPIPSSSDSPTPTSSSSSSSPSSADNQLAVGIANVTSDYVIGILQMLLMIYLWKYPKQRNDKGTLHSVTMDSKCIEMLATQMPRTSLRQTLMSSSFVPKRFASPHRKINSALETCRKRLSTVLSCLWRFGSHSTEVPGLVGIYAALVPRRISCRRCRALEPAQDLMDLIRALLIRGKMYLSRKPNAKILANTAVLPAKLCSMCEMAPIKGLRCVSKTRKWAKDR